MKSWPNAPTYLLYGSKFYDFSIVFIIFLFAKEHFHRHRWKFPDIYVAAKWTKDKPTYQLRIWTLSIQEKKPKNKKQKETVFVCVRFFFLVVLNWVKSKHH